MSDRASWEARHRTGGAAAAPSAFVAAQVAALAPPAAGACALDLACGGGRHARLLADAGYRTIALDHARAACRQVAALDPRVQPLVADAAALPLAPSTFALIVQTRFLDRAIVPDLLHLLAPGGVLLIETFLVAQHDATGHPRREFCLAPGELVELCTGGASAVRVRAHHEGPVGTGASRAHLAAIAVCKV